MQIIGELLDYRESLKTQEELDAFEEGIEDATLKQIRNLNYMGYRQVIAYSKAYYNFKNYQVKGN